MTTPAQLACPSLCVECSDDEFLAAADDDIHLGLDQAAAHAARLAIARWRQAKSGAQEQLAAALRASAQERWYAQTLDQLEAWRADGGFAHDAAVPV